MTLSRATRRKSAVKPRAHSLSLFPFPSSVKNRSKNVAALSAQEINLERELIEALVHQRIADYMHKHISIVQIAIR